MADTKYLRIFFHHRRLCAVCSRSPRLLDPRLLCPRGRFLLGMARKYRLPEPLEAHDAGDRQD
jgi:hypothetical protein